jgi:hypothetical protein
MLLKLTKWGIPLGWVRQIAEITPHIPQIISIDCILILDILIPFCILESFLERGNKA